MSQFVNRPTTIESASRSATPTSELTTPLPDAEAAPPVITFSEQTNSKSEDHDIAKPFAEALQAIGNSEKEFQKYTGAKSSKSLTATDAAINTVQMDVATAQSYASTMKPVYESDAMKTIRDGVNTLVDSLPGLLRALDEVAKLHPFIGIAVGAFRVVVELDVKRRDNDQKITVLFVEMRNMMEALLQLRGIKDEDSMPDGQTIKARMQKLIEQTAEDIKMCANACDAYAKKNLIVKVIKSSSWEDKLKGFIDLFANRRKEFTFALSIHVGVSVDDATRKLKEIDTKIDMVLAFFPKVVSPEQLELAALVQKKGGPTAVMGDNDALKELLKFRPATAIGQAKRGSGPQGAERNSHQDGDELAVVKQELFDSPELAIKKNLEVFERKFKMQQRELAEEMRRMVHHEGDRVIEAVTSGPHDRIVDPDIHEIWKDMRWPGHVKARHFVLALRDYYTQQVERKRKVTHGDAVVNRVADQDEWALEWINLNRLQAIVEAFDDDGSGFITIAEVNHFTASRPKEWRFVRCWRMWHRGAHTHECTSSSLPHWLAYWAIGWQMTATKYRDMIVEICAKMFAILSHIHPMNRNTVDRYLRAVWQNICTLTSSFHCTYQGDLLEERFKSYVDAEEQRLREALEAVKYKIDAMDALVLVTGPGRIEKHLFPLLWLLLHRDFEIFRLCQGAVVHKDELSDSIYTLSAVFDAVRERHNDLQDLFKQQKLDPGQQFKTFASEVFDLWHDWKKFWSLDNLRELEFLEVEYEDSMEDQNVDVGKLLNRYASAVDDLYPPPVEDSITKNDAAADEATRLILGRWNGYKMFDSEITGTMITFCLRASMDNRMYEASAVDEDGMHFNILGNYTIRDDETVEYAFTWTYLARSYTQYWTGTLDDDGNTFSGKWGYEKDDQAYTFIFKRVPPEVLIDRPHPKEFTENRVKALWKYALTAVRNQIRRRLFSWSYLKERRDMRKECLELLLREMDGRLTMADYERSSVFQLRLTFDDIRYVYVLRDYRQRAFPDVICDHCRSPIYGTRVACMECGSRFTFDFCDKPACVGCTIETRDDVKSPHLPSHDFVKIRTPILHHREIGKVLRNAKAGLERAKNLLEKADAHKCGGLVETLSENHDDNKPGEEKDGDDGEDGEDVEASVSFLEQKVAPSRRKAMAPPVSESKDEIVNLACLRCEASISQPWCYCIECPEDSKAFICWHCDESEGGFSYGEHHLATHNLVRCMKAHKEGSKSEDDRTGKRLDALEHKLEGLTGQMAGFTTQVAGLTSQIERIEKLLQLLSNAPTG
ncbi:hypothetical protein LXA43DRAFT_99677 [Ganoderma leucocontextum]|nr:hypothetical protein LXA43DRAFT_99677 [Ganoderma leucocontextum]